MAQTDKNGVSEGFNLVCNITALHISYQRPKRSVTCTPTFLLTGSKGQSLSRLVMSSDVRAETSTDFGGFKVAPPKLRKTKVNFALCLYIHGGVYRGWLM